MYCTDNTFGSIHGFSKYKITPNGLVLNVETNMWLSGSVNPAGYCNYRLTDDQGVCMTMGRHRLIALAFIPCFSNHASMVVNHKNGIKGDDRVENLEWVTPQENVEHAGCLGITDKCTPLYVRDVDTEKIVLYPSATACGRSLGLTKDAILYRLSHSPDRIYPERKQYKAYHNSTPWSNLDNIDHRLAEYGKSRAVEIRDFSRQQTFLFDRLSDAASFYQVSAATMTDWAAKPNQPILPGLIQIKFVSDQSPWRNVLDPLKELFESSPIRPVVVIDTISENYTIFPSCVDCANSMGLSTTALNYRLKSNGNTIFSDGCRYKYYENQVLI